MHCGTVESSSTLIELSKYMQMNWSPRKKQPKPDSGGAKGGTRRTSPRPKCVSSRPENNKRNQQGNGAGAKHKQPHPRWPLVKLCLPIVHPPQNQVQTILPRRRWKVAYAIKLVWDQIELLMGINYTVPLKVLSNSSQKCTFRASIINAYCSTPGIQRRAETNLCSEWRLATPGVSSTSVAT